MKTIPKLTNASLVRVKGIRYAEITICTLAAYAEAHKETVAYLEGLDLKFNRPTQYAWVMKHSGMLTADYPGKAKAHAEKWAAIDAAPEIETGDVLEIDGVQYVTKVMGDYSDPVHLTKL